MEREVQEEKLRKRRKTRRRRKKKETRNGTRIKIKKVKLETTVEGRKEKMNTDGETLEQGKEN